MVDKRSCSKVWALDVSCMKLTSGTRYVLCRLAFLAAGIRIEHLCTSDAPPVDSCCCVGAASQLVTCVRNPRALMTNRYLDLVRERDHFVELSSVRKAPSSCAKPAVGSYLLGSYSENVRLLVCGIIGIAIQSTCTALFSNTAYSVKEARIQDSR